MGTLGGSSSYAYGINNAGHVTGFSALAGNPTPGIHAFLYDGQLHDLGALNDCFVGCGPPSLSTGAKINDYDQIVGTTHGPGGVIAFLWDPANGMRSLGLPNTIGIAINNTGQALLDPNTIAPGQTTLSFIFDLVTGSQEFIPSLPNLPGCLPNATALNDSGTVVGSCSLVPSGPQVPEPQAFVWDAENGTRALDSAGSLESLAWSINNSGQISGSITPALGVGRAVVWDQSGIMQQLALVIDKQGNTLNTDAYSINTNGDVVGIGSQNAVTWIECNGYLLDDLIPPNSGWHLIQASAINDARQIVGYGVINGETHAFLLDPVIDNDRRNN